MEKLYNEVLCSRHYKNECDFLKDIEYTQEEWNNYIVKNGYMTEWNNEQRMNFINDFLPIIIKKYQ